MSTEPAFVEYVLDQLSDLEGIRVRPMMGEYVLYYRERIAGGLYDGRLLIKPVEAAVSFMKQPVFAIPYQGARQMLLVESLEDRDFLNGLFTAMADELPLPRPKKKKTTENRKRKKEQE